MRSREVSVKMRGIALVAHINGKDGSNVGDAEIAGFCVDTVKPSEMGEDTKGPGQIKFA